MEVLVRIRSTLDFLEKTNRLEKIIKWNKQHKQNQK